jgi:hypothetical protein
MDSNNINDQVPQQEPSIVRRAVASIAGWVFTFVGLLILGVVLNQLGIRMPWMPSNHEKSSAYKAPGEQDLSMLDEFIKTQRERMTQSGYRYTKFDEFILAYHEHEYAKAKGRTEDLEFNGPLIKSGYGLHLQITEGTDQRMSFLEFLADSLGDLRRKQGRVGFTNADAEDEMRSAYEQDLLEGGG